MEKLEQLQQTLREVDERVPAAFRLALGRLGDRLYAPPSPAEEEEDDVANFVASLLLPPPPATEAAEDDSCLALAEAEPDDDGTQPGTDLRLLCGSCYVPHHDHDAHFVAHAGAGVFGVADGVGAYMLYGVDAGAFSRGLMESARGEASAAAPPVSPYALLEVAHEKTVASGAPGASTAAILSLAGGGRVLKWAYVGDSGFAVVRGGRIARRSTPQRHFYTEAPFQLAGDTRNSDGAACASVGEAAARAGDVVVAGTDGLFDNVGDAQLERAVMMGTELGFSPKNMADVIAGVAYEASRRPGGGGKPDDITVVVAFVVPSES
ncbi:unnamed protein product [Urochloa decumbens]|uniref:Protein phosphatase n=1 Tax=Urochloa decumbens TaxID=240449 RepID=A0ABC8ZUL3_9POAL